MTRTFLLFASMMLGCTTTLADDYHEQQARLKALDKRCEQARQKVLRPVRENLIQKCVGTERRALQDCQLEFNEYGESTTGPRGNVIRGLYYDLPECAEAKRAWDAWEASQPMRR